MQIEFHALADKEVLKSHRRYLRRSPITATRYLAALEKAIEQIVAAPDRSSTAWLLEAPQLASTAQLFD